MKVRHGFVSNSSSSSFIAIIEKDLLNEFGFTASQQAFIEIMRSGYDTGVDHSFLDTSVIVITMTSGNYDDTDWVNMKDFACSVMDHATKLNDPLLSEYKEELETAISHAAWDYFRDLFYEARKEIQKIFKTLQEEGLCIVTTLDF